MSASFDEPSIPPRLRRPLAALWISLGLHAAVIALVQVVPPAGVSVEAPVIEVRLVAPPAPAANVPPPPSPVVPVPAVAPVAQLAPSPAPKALPVAPPPPAVVPPPTTTPAHDAPLPMAPTVPAAAKTAPALSPEAAPVPAAALTSSVDLTYYNARDLDVQPHALRVIRPDYPAEADRQRVSGTLRLQLKLEADGRVSDIEIVSATPPGVFEDSAIKAFRDARFAPAQKNGRPVRALVVIEVVYDWAGQPR
ncbi:MULTISPECIES: energy transducer TonB [unclassified Thiobacillus]|uniref:energy transducer TonB n=1 Tax=unclassified Thiobacillus TaxID=2646513 RepID=UPI00086C2D4D|nr:MULTISPECIES: energy transducer TonB [unclassified Thiobacillus]MBN8778508.1 energy transducer TonB [Thiobacillus sp.]ODV01113.1 MAG: energy transducer TonB [Thiobacillus sp. SCN 63-57]